MAYQTIKEVPDSNTVFQDTVFMEANQHLSEQWVRISEVYPSGVGAPLLPETLLREQFGQGNHYECFFLSALATLVRFPDVIRNCFVSRSVRRDGRYTFQFFRDREWVKVEIDDRIALDEGDTLFIRSPTEHWWPLLLEKAYAKFYTGYDNLEGCAMQEAYHDLTGKPVLNIPMETKLAKTVGADVADGCYWLDLAQKFQSGQFTGSLLTKDMDLDSMGLQHEQQYGILDIFSLTGTSAVSDIVVRLHNPFEDDEFLYKGPLNSKDTQWTPKLRAKHDVDDERSIFLPLSVVLKIVNSMQLCFMSSVDEHATYFDDEWKGDTAGGNPTMVTWRKNPLYCVRNVGTEAVQLVVVIKQKDQRRFTSPEEHTKYLQCGVVVVQNNSPNQIPTHFVTGNNHKAIFKSLFLNSREVANAVTIPPSSLCYLVPSCLMKGATGEFTIALYRMGGEDYSGMTIRKLSLPDVDWAHPAEQHVKLEMKLKDRVDFYVECKTDIHILVHQEKPYKGKSGGDVMTQDYVGAYLYDDTDRKIGGVHAATNFRETSILHHLPRSGRYAISVTCPRATEEVPVLVTIVGSHEANVRIVDAPEDAAAFEDDDSIDEGGDGAALSNPIDFVPVNIVAPKLVEVPDSALPFEDKRFMNDNRSVTTDPWIHIGDLYPEGKGHALLPEVLCRDQFEQGEHFECCCLVAFSALVDNHPDVIRNCFISKSVRRDGRYTFQFFRYGQWVKVEIDDRIPMVDGRVLFVRSPTGHWWPLLLEKAYAKFYTLYRNLEGCTLREIFHDLTGKPVLNIPMETKLAKAVMCDVDEASFWLELDEDLRECACTAVAQRGFEESHGLLEGQAYGILGVVAMGDCADASTSGLLVKLHNPLVEMEYTGPMNAKDSRWTAELRTVLDPDQCNTIYVPVDVFREAFTGIDKALLRGLVQPAWHFNSEWGDGTNGGNPTLVTWRENPLYVVRNTSDNPIQITAMIGQPDQRHMLHLLPGQDFDYLQCGFILARNTTSNPIPTYLVTSNNHRLVHKGLFVNFRDTADIIIIPPLSMSYIVPSAMYRDKTKFLLSYWYSKPADARQVKIERLTLNVARDLPAIEHLELRNKEKGRVDFVVDVPTDIHVLVRQDKPCAAATVGDAMADNFLGIYLYDSSDKRIHGVTSATNYRETGIVHRLPAAGRYALSITCPRGSGVVPCKVEIVGVAEAKVRITDAPENAGELGGVDLQFLDAEPHGVPLDDLPLDDDDELSLLLDELQKLHDDPDGNAKEIVALEARVSDRVHTMAMRLLGKDRPKYLPGYDRDMLNPFLDNSSEYISLESVRHALKKDPRNATKIRNVEKELHALAGQISVQATDPDLSFLGAEVDGIPVGDISLMNDKAFCEVAMMRVQLKRDAVANASRISDLEVGMIERAHELAREMHVRERAFLDQEPEGVPLDLLPLNEDDGFSITEDRLRALNRKARKDVRLVSSVEDELSERAHELAAELKESERTLFLDPQPKGFALAELPLDEDSVFHGLEVQRLRLRKADAEGNVAAIKVLEKQMNERALELAWAKLRSYRAFLDPMPLGIPIQNLCLDSDSGFLSKEAELRVLLRDPRRNAAAIRAVEEELSRIVEGIAARHAALERDFLAAEYEGRPVDGLPLSDDKTFLSLEARRRQLVAGGGSGRDVRALEEEMGTLACSIARALNVKERPDYLSAYTKGVPLEDLPLDSDDAFRKLEVRRQQVKSDPRRGPADVADVEKSLQERAECLAKRRLSADRGYLDPAPAGVPLRLLPLDADDAFESLETQRALLTKNTRRNAKSIAALEGDLNERAHELAVALKRAERARFLDPVPSGIPLADVPIDSDDAFYDAEIRRLVLREDLEGNAAAISELEDAMNARAFELAGKVREKMRTFLDPMPLGIPLEELDLDAEEAFVAAENELHELRRDPRRNAAAIATLETGLRKLVYQIAARVVARERAFLDSDPEGRELAELPLNDDKEFRELEAERRWLKKDPHKNAARIAEVEERLNERAHELARAINCAERKAYLGSDPWGVSVADLPLDTDREFCKLELRRAFLMRDRERNKRQIEELEEALDRRAEELARRRLEEERGFLDREPQGIPLALLALDEDAAFHAKEVERLALKEQNLRRNEGRIRDLEDAMGERANEIARQVRLRERERLLGTAVGGVSLDVLCLDRDAPYVELEVAYVKGLRGGGDAGAVADIADAMRKRCGDILHRLKCEARSTLEPCPLGVPLEDLPLDESEVFVGREQALLELRSAPVHNAAAVAAAVQALNSITMELAREHVKGERDFLDREPEGRLISELPLNEDATFLGLEKQRRQLKKDPFMDEYRLADIEQLMNDRAHELAKKLNAAERTYFLALSVHGVPVSELPLDGDGEFARLEAERARLRRSPARCAARLEEVEDALSRRAEELAMDALQQDRLFLGEELEGVPVRHLPLSEDVEFSALESKRAALKGRDPQLCAKAICDLEEQLRDRAAELAIGVKGELRALLAPHPLGVPLAALPLDDDERFYALEQNYRELSADPTNAKKRDEILSQLNDRAIEMARCLHAEERAALDQRPEGIPLSVLPLNEDETFNTLETEARLLRCGSFGRPRNCARLQELEDAMNDRAVELARELRQSYCDAAPAGVPLELLALGGVSEFTKMEESLFELRKDPKANKKAISDLEFELNNMARTAARTMLEKDRGYLEDGPSGASLRALPIDVDPVFHALEVERAVLRSKGDRRNSRRVRELEEKLIERAQALAEEQLAEDLSGLDKEPEGIPLSQLGLQSDAAFGEMVRVIRELKKDPKKHAAAIEDARERMNDRAHELAQEKLVSDRAYLDRRPEGVPLEILPLCSDAVFRRLEVERARLKARDPVRNAGKIRDAEARLNDRVAELAQEQKQLDLRDLNQTPRGVPIHILDLHSDPVFQGMVDELRVMRSRPHTRVPDLASLLRRMDAHADAVAAERLRADRGYLEPDPLGVPLSRLRLSTDPVFCDLEAQRAVQKSQDARRNAARIADLEARLVSRVAELAQEQRERELEGLDPAPEGIPLAVLDPHSDGEFAVLVDALRALPDGPQADGDAAALRAAMNERVHALARGHRAHARGQLDSDPEGVPLDVLPLDGDAVLRELEAEYATLRAQDPRLHARRLRELEVALNNRVHELARAQLREDVAGVEEAPCGVPLGLLHLHGDAAFAALVDDVRALKRDPEANADAIAGVVTAMNDRARAVAANALVRDYLDAEPLGVPLDVLPLGEDPVFRELELERARLRLSDERRNAHKIRRLEDEMNARVAELAALQRKEDLSGVDACPEGIPLELLGVFDDAAFASAVPELRELKKDRPRNAERIRELEDVMNNRAYEIADGLLEGDRGYLDSMPLGVPIAELPLCADEQFASMEVERAKLKARDPRRNASKVADLEARLNARAAELAKNQLAEDLQGFAGTYEGVDLSRLRPHDNKEFASMVPELRRLKKARDDAALQLHRADMDRCLGELARELVGGDLWFLEREPGGVPLTYLPLDDDSAFERLRRERARLREDGLRANAEQIVECERAMNARACELAAEVRDADFEGVDQEPHGVPLALLPLRDDPVAAKIIPQLREARYGTATAVSRAKLRDLVAALDRRAHEVACDVLAADRQRYLDRDPEGVSLDDLPLSTDPRFHALELEHVALGLKDPRANARRLGDLEECLNERARELAREQLQEDLRGLEPAPCGVPLAVLQPHRDAALCNCVALLRELKRAPHLNSRRLDEVRKRMNDRTHELARALLDGGRECLDPSPEGVALADLRLDEDEDFHALEVERLVLCSEDLAGNAGAIEALAERLNERARELAVLQLQEDLRSLGGSVRGVPLALLGLHGDPECAGYVAELRRLRKDPRRNADVARATEARLGARADELAALFLHTDRTSYLDPEPLGVALDMLPLDTDPDFLLLEAERLPLLLEPRSNKKAMAELESALNARAAKLAEQQLHGDRGYLDREPEGVPLCVLPLDSDRQFHELEVERAVLKARGSVRHAAAVEALEQRLNDRAHTLAEEQVAEDLSGVDAAPRGIPIGLLRPHGDPQFHGMVEELRRLKAAPAANVPAIQALVSDMSGRACALADRVLDSCRERLDPFPEGVPLESLALEDDAVFHQLLLDLAALKLGDQRKNASRIADVEERLNDRVSELATAAKCNDLECLDSSVCGVPIGLLKLHDDREFAYLANNIRCGSNLSRNISTGCDVEALRCRATEVAKELISSSRAFLDKEPNGVPVAALHVDDDDEFNGMQLERLKLLLTDPRCNADKISDLESRLNDRARLLASQYLSRDRDFLESEPCGVPLADIDLDDHPLFHRLETERAKLKLRDPLSNAFRIRELEEKMNGLAHDLARQILAEDFNSVDQLPKGIPLSCLKTHDDPEISSLIRQLRHLRRDPASSPAKLKHLRDMMNDRVHQLAQNAIAESRKQLDREPEGVPLEMLPLDADKQFRSMEGELVALLAAPLPNNVAIQNLRDSLNIRARELATEKVQGDRVFLDSQPEGVDLSDIPLDANPTFRSMEAERARLKERFGGNSDAVTKLEDALNELAREMARNVKSSGRSFLNAMSHGIPRDMLPLDEDRNFVMMEQRRRRLLRDKRRNSSAIESLKEMMQDRVDDLALRILKGDRASYLQIPDGMSIADISIDDDDAFKNLELQRALHKLNGSSSKSKAIDSLERQMNERIRDIIAECVGRERYFLDPEPEGIPLKDVSLDSDAQFKHLEGQLRQLCRVSRRQTAAVTELQDAMNERAHELAKMVVLEDLKCLAPEYRRIPTVDLNLHSEDAFRAMANKVRGVGVGTGTKDENIASIVRMMNERACEVANNIIEQLRAFLDKEPEGMLIHDLPLDTDDTFVALESERRIRLRDPRWVRRNKDVLRELEAAISGRVHELAREGFMRLRDFMNQEPEGIPLQELPLDVDVVFKEAEVARYRLKRTPNHSLEELGRLEAAMNDRAMELAREAIAKDHGFLDPRPEGVPLEELSLNSDEEFKKLALERRQLKKETKHITFHDVKLLEERMNDRVHELAKEYLRKCRAFLDPEPEGVPIEDVPVDRDAAFVDSERQLARLRRDQGFNPEKAHKLEDILNERAREVARGLLKRERVFLDQEPLGVPLSDLPLNFNPTLNALERKRRLLKKNPKNNSEAIRACEDEIQDCVHKIAREFIEEERAFLEQKPRGVPLALLSLNTDRLFRLMEVELRTLRKNTKRNKSDVETVQEQMRARVEELAGDFLRKNRLFLHPEPLGVPVEELPLDSDDIFRGMESEHRGLKQNETFNVVQIRTLEDQMNQRAKELAAEFLAAERAFLDQYPQGIPLTELLLSNDRKFRGMERVLRALRKDPRPNTDKIKICEDDMKERVHKLACRKMWEDRHYLPLEIYGFPISELPLDGDKSFRDMEQQRRHLRQDPQGNPTANRDMEERLTERAFVIAKDFLWRERSYLDQQPHGIPIREVPLGGDEEFLQMEKRLYRMKREFHNANEILQLEEMLNKRAHYIAENMFGWRDVEFHKVNQHAAEKWPRIGELYPEGAREPVVPEVTSPSDVSSAPRELGYLAPFIAVLSRHPQLIHRLIDSKAHPVNAPYSFIFFDPHSNPVRVDIDDCVPVNANFEPKFTRVPRRSWYPLLLEKAYAKFVGGYDKLDHCTPHETLRDLTGRPVLHVPFDDRLAEAANTGDFRSTKFWREVRANLDQGDVMTCISNPDCVDGIHPQCSYAVLGVVETVSESNDPSDVVIKLHNCYPDEPVYSGPLRRNDRRWTEELKRVCRYHPDEDVLYLPLPVFLRNFSSMQRCHVNCGDRLTSVGEWNEVTGGGNPRYTSFRNNPIYLVENKSSRPVTILAELRHHAPASCTPDGINQYHQSGMVLMKAMHPKMPVSPLITSVTHRFLQKGMMLDAREVCMQLQLPPSTTCYLIPYALRRENHGKFSISIYPGLAKVSLTPLRNAGLRPMPVCCTVAANSESVDGARVDFSVDIPCDVHVLLKQSAVETSNSLEKGDAVADEHLSLAVFNEEGVRLATTGHPTNSTEQALVFAVPQGGRYTLILTSLWASKLTSCSCQLFIYTQRGATASLVPVSDSFVPLKQYRSSVLSRRAPSLLAVCRSNGNVSGFRGSSALRRNSSLSPQHETSTLSYKGANNESPNSKQAPN